MKLRLSAAVLLASMAVATTASARDTVLYIPLADVLAMPEAQEKLDKNMKFFLAGQTTPKVLKRFSTDVSNPKTNGVGKSDEFGCKWAALSALINLQNSARREGANAVVDIVSYYKKTEYRNAANVECHAGAVIIGVALKGTYAQIAE